ncbi:hypothetical protein GC175_27495 [bacterium]|nr:hypothetical protein [bacterium]
MPSRSSRRSPKTTSGGASQRSAGGANSRRTSYKYVIQRAQADPDSLSAEDVLTLQRTIGNQSTQRLLQPKPTPGTGNPSPPNIQRNLATPSIQRDPWQPGDRTQGTGRGGLQIGGNRQWQGGTATGGTRGGVTIGGSRQPATTPTWQTGTATATRGRITLGNNSEERQKEILIQKIRNDYGIDINQNAGIQAVQDAYPNAPDAVRNGLRAREWTLQELQDVDRALGHYSALLGANRPGVLGLQPITSFSRLEQGIDEDLATGVLDNRTAGETFTNNITMFDAGTDIRDFAANKNAPTADELRQGFRGTIEHELSHGLIESIPVNGQTMLEEFADQMAFWDDVFTCHYNDPLRPGSKQRRRELALADGTEAPITVYGAQDALEDLAEAMMFYFEDPGRLAAECPERFAFIRDNVQPILDGNPIV